MNNCKLDPIDTSKYIISYLSKKGYSVNHLKLQKLLYYVEAWYNVFTDNNVFKEDIEAWEHGPVIRVVWNYFKKYSILYDNIPYKKDYKFNASEEQLQIINDVLNEYGNKTGYYLENLTHSEEPWKLAVKTNKVINKNFMKEYYRKKLNDKA